MLNKRIKLASNTLYNLTKCSTTILRELKKMAGWNNANIGWLDSTGTIHTLQRGETHYEAAIRFVKNTDPKAKQAIRELKSHAEDLNEGGGVVDYHKVYEYMIHKYNLIRVSADGFDTPMNETSLGRIGNFIKNNFQGQTYMNFYISNIDNIHDTTTVPYDIIEEENFNIARALGKTKQRSRLMGMR